MQRHDGMTQSGVGCQRDDRTKDDLQLRILSTRLLKLILMTKKKCLVLAAVKLCIVYLDQ